MPNTSDYSPDLCYDKTVSFAAATTSDAIDLSGCRVMGIITPASLASANTFTIQGATTLTGTYIDIKNEAGVAISVPTVANGDWVDLTNVFPASVRFMKLKSSGNITATITLATTPRVA